jgi:hypothetical protein
MVDAGDAGAADAGDAGAADAGGSVTVPTFTTCLGIRYLQSDPANAFAGINWVPNTGGVNSCFTGVTAIEFWAAGTVGAKVNFSTVGGMQTITLTAEWKKYRIPVVGISATDGVPIAFTVGFDGAGVTGPGPVRLYYADPTFVGN